MAFDGGLELFAVGGVAPLDTAVEDEVALAAGEKDLVTVDDFPLALDDDIGVRLEYGHDFLHGGHVFAIEYAALALIDHLFGQGRELLQRVAQRGRGQELLKALAPRVGQFFQGLAGIAERLSRRLDEAFVQWLAIVRTPGVVDFVQQLLRQPGVVVEAPPQALDIRFRLAEDPAKDAHAVPQLARAGGMMNVAFHRRGVDADSLAVLDPLAAGVTDKQILNVFESLVAAGQGRVV